MNSIFGNYGFYLLSCLDGATQLLNTTSYTREHLRAPCIREEKVIRNAVSCESLPESELKAGRDFTIRHTDDNRNSNRSIVHVYPCGTGGSPCSRRIVRIEAIRSPEGCQCSVKREEGVEACCCDSDRNTGRSQAVQKSQWIKCDSPDDHPLSIRQQRHWHLVDGKCWPITLTSSKRLSKF